jgi:hypothetical protein
MSRQDPNLAVVEPNSKVSSIDNIVDINNSTASYGFIQNDTSKFYTLSSFDKNLNSDCNEPDLSLTEKINIILKNCLVKHANERANEDAEILFKSGLLELSTNNQET